MVNFKTPRVLQSLLIGGALATGLMLTGCNAGQISGATPDGAAIHASSRTANLTNGGDNGGGTSGGGGTTPWGDHNNDCTVDPGGC